MNKQRQKEKWKLALEQTIKSILVTGDKLHKVRFRIMYHQNDPEALECAKTEYAVLSTKLKGRKDEYVKLSIALGIDRAWQHNPHLLGHGETYESNGLLTGGPNPRTWQGWPATTTDGDLQRINPLHVKREIDRTIHDVLHHVPNGYRELT